SHYPPISILDSISRIMPAVISADHLAKTNVIRRLFATYKASEELIRIGAYQKNSDPDLDRAIALMPELRDFLIQPSQEVACMKDSLDRLMALPASAVSFRFVLAPLLRLRQSIERQRALQLQEANLQVSRAQETLAHLDRFLSDSARSDCAALAVGRSAAELQ